MTVGPRVHALNGDEEVDRQANDGRTTTELIVPGYVLLTWTRVRDASDGARLRFRLASGRKPPLELYIDPVDRALSEIDVSIEDSDTPSDVDGAALPPETQCPRGFGFELEDWAGSDWWEEEGAEAVSLLDDGLLVLLWREVEVLQAARSGSLVYLLGADSRLLGFKIDVSEDELASIRAVFGSASS